MNFSNIQRSIPLALCVIGCSLAITPPVSAQPEAAEATTSELRPLQSDSILSMDGASKVMDAAIAAIADKDYAVAEERLQEARQVYNQLSNFHLDLANSFQGLDNQVYDAERRQAIAAGEMRDTATYRLALVHRVQEEPELAVPLLIQVIRSQNPTTDLGEKAYQQLFELGFVSQEFTKPSF